MTDLQRAVVLGADAVSRAPSRSWRRRRDARGPTARSAWPRRDDGQRHRPAVVQRLRRAVGVLEAGLEADRAAVDARAGGAAERVVPQQVLGEGGHARVRPGDLLGDRVVFGLLGRRARRAGCSAGSGRRTRSGRSADAAGIAWAARGQVERARDRRESVPIVTLSAPGVPVGGGHRDRVGVVRVAGHLQLAARAAICRSGVQAQRFAHERQRGDVVAGPRALRTLTRS